MYRQEVRAGGAGRKVVRMAKVRIHHFREMKQRGEKITMLTAYDYPTARAFDSAGVDALLVGDSLADNILGYDSTQPLTIDEMVPFVRAVARGAERAFVIADLPFGSYEQGPEQAVASAVDMVKRTGATAVKFEGGRRIARHAPRSPVCCRGAAPPTAAPRSARIA